MGYVDADSHCWEYNHTWDFFDPDEEVYRPVITEHTWTVEDLTVHWTTKGAGGLGTGIFPEGSVDLRDPAARLRYMDELGIDVHVIYPTYCANTEASNAIRQAALSRSYNRWLAERTADSDGRLRWLVDAPVRTMDRCLEELRFGKEHGAAGVLVRALSHGRSLADPQLIPMYECAQDLDLAITVHTGHDWRTIRRDHGSFLHAAVMPVPGSFWTVLNAGLHTRFPQLRWGFLEAGAAWLPWVMQELYRAEDGAVRSHSYKDWRAAAADELREAQLFVAAQMDDDLPALVELTGEDRLVLGTDFGHLDVGSDPNGLHVVAHRPDVERAVARKIVDDNARRLYGIDPMFRPAPPPTIEGPVLDPGWREGRSSLVGSPGSRLPDKPAD